jgi:hypothetical protein
MRVVVVAALGALAIAAAVLATQRDWPFAKSIKYSASAYAQPGWDGRPLDQIRPAEELWSGEVSLTLNRPYGLDEKPDKLVEPCGGCLKLEDLPNGAVALRAENGIVPWPGKARPSYYDCVRLREAGTLDYISFATSSGNGGGLALHRWMCATGRKDDIVRLQYQGVAQGGMSCQFDVTAWHRPFMD